MITSAKIARYVLIISIIIVLSIILPEFYSMMFYKSTAKARVSYSPIAKKFLLLRYKTNEVFREDAEGNQLSRDEFERLTPLFNYRALIYREEMPDTIDGIPIDIKNVRLNNIYFRIRPKEMFYYSIPLNPLLESEPGRPNLEMPEEYFRIDDKFEFILAQTNTVVPELSQLFNNALVEKGFSFPARKMFGNPTTRKPFDEGFFIVDNDDKLFHLKRVHNKPYVAQIKIPSNLKIQYITVKEMPLKEFYGLIISEDNNLFLISYDNYKLIELPSDGYNLKNTQLIFKGNILYREIHFIKQNSIKTIVTDRNYKIVDTYYEKWETNKESTTGTIEQALFPFSLSLTDINNSYINFYFKVSDFPFLLSNIVLLLVAIVLFATKFKRNNSTKIFDLIIVLVTGLYGLIAVLLIRDED